MLGGGGKRHITVLTRQRDRDARKEVAVAHNAQTQNIMMRAEWENKTDNAIVQRRTKEKMEKMAEEAERQLLARRRRLADLYNQEMDGWRDEVANNVETLEVRKKRIYDRAMQLKNRREMERQKLVENCYARQWRDANDEARTLDSKAMLEYVAKERRKQIGQKELEMEKQREEDAKFRDEWQARMRLLEEADKLEEQKRIERNMKMKHALDQQVYEHVSKERVNYEQKMAEDDEEIERLRRRAALEEEEKLRRKAEAHERRIELHTFNEEQRRIRKELYEEERKRDMLLLQHAQEKELADEAAEEERRRREKDMTMQYQAYLQDQMVKEKEDEAEVNRIRQEEENKIWERREAELRRQQEARERLMQDVDHGRRAQLQRQAQDLESMRNQEQMDARQAHEQYLKAIEEERRREIELRGRNQDNAIMLKQQMDERMAQARREKQSDYLMVKEMERHEKLHKKKLESQAGVVQTYRPLKHTQWYT